MLKSVNELRIDAELKHGERGNGEYLCLSIDGRIYCVEKQRVGSLKN